MRFLRKDKNYAPIILFYVVTAVLLMVPVIFTGMKLGWFNTEPAISTKITAVSDAPVLRIVADKGFKPRSYRKENGDWAGSDIEIAVEVANRLGMRPQVVFTDWLTARNTIAKGEADIILGLEIFSNMQGMDKTIPILHDQLKVYGKNAASDAAALAGKKIGLIGKSVIISLFQLNCEYVEFYNYADMLAALNNNKIDYAICHESVADCLIKDKNYSLNKGFTLMQSYPAFGVRADAQELKNRLNGVLSGMAEDGTLQAMVNKWLSRAESLSVADVFNRNHDIYLFYFLFFVVIEAILIIYILQDISHHKEMVLIATSNTDELTRVFNRRAYENTMSSHKFTILPKNLVYVAIDINGLKEINDSKGHAAGDELIIGAANCLKQCFGTHGNIYRIGGDEFVVILYAEEAELGANAEGLRRGFG